MCFTRRKRKDKNKVYPYVSNPSLKEINEIKTEDFVKECIVCYGCKEIFNLDSNEIKIHCAGCSQFFHCGIAGQCNGQNCCSLTMRNKYHRLSWCVKCVPKIEGNEEKIDGKGYCTCNDCIKIPFHGTTLLQ